MKDTLNSNCDCKLESGGGNSPSPFDSLHVACMSASPGNATRSDSNLVVPDSTQTKSFLLLKLSPISPRQSRLFRHRPVRSFALFGSTESGLSLKPVCDLPYDDCCCGNDDDRHDSQRRPPRAATYRLPVRRVATDGPRRVEGGKRHRYQVDLLRALEDSRAMKTQSWALWR